MSRQTSRHSDDIDDLPPPPPSPPPLSSSVLPPPPPAFEDDEPLPSVPGNFYEDNQNDDDDDDDQTNGLHMNFRLSENVINNKHDDGGSRQHTAAAAADSTSIAVTLQNKFSYDTDSKPVRELNSASLSFQTNDNEDVAAPRSVNVSGRDENGLKTGGIIVAVEEKEDEQKQRVRVSGFGSHFTAN